MSLKVMHTRPDGTIVPIKVSIWDAFKGVPDPKPRKPKPCSCCKRIHCGKTRVMIKQGDKDVDKDNTKINGKNESKKEDDEGLTDDDRIILRMKENNESASWAEIYAATSNFNHVGEVKNRFKQIKHHLQGGQKSDSNAVKKKDKNADKEEIARMRREEGLKKAAEKRAAKEAEENARKEDAKKDDDEKKSTKSGRAKNHIGSAGDFKKWAEEYDKNKGVVLAARHFDATGIRISAKEALMMIEQKYAGDDIAELRISNTGFAK